MTSRREKLVVDAPVGVLDAQDLALLVRHKEQLIRFLTRASPDELPPNWHVFWDERAAIME